MLITLLLVGFDDLRNGFVAGEKCEEEAVCMFWWREGSEEVGILGHVRLPAIQFAVVSRKI
jgi:hypothetical protein